MKKLVPEYVTIQRIQRDIPVPLIEAGVDKGHLRELVTGAPALAGSGMPMHPLPRGGAAGHERHHSLDDLVPRTVIATRRPAGREEFISFVLENNALAGYVRLRLPGRGIRPWSAS